MYGITLVGALAFVHHTWRNIDSPIDPTIKIKWNSISSRAFWMLKQFVDDNKVIDNKDVVLDVSGPHDHTSNNDGARHGVNWFWYISFSL